MNQKEQVQCFLEALRRLGYINMFGAARYIEAFFPEINQRESVEYLSIWMSEYNSIDYNNKEAAINLYIEQIGRLRAHHLI